MTRRFIKISCWFLSAILALPAFGQIPSTIRRLDRTAITPSRADAIASSELTRDHVTGAQLAILNHGHVVWTYAFGFRDVEHQLPMTTDTDMGAASITKPVFATWVMRLGEEHRIDLDQPIAKMLSQPLNDYAPYRDSAADLVRDPQWQLVTPRMLLSHTSGLGTLLGIEHDHKFHLHFRPGSHYAYSNAGYSLLQFAIEQKLNLSIAQSMQDDIFTPLDMTRTSMVKQPSFAENAALPYDANGDLITRRVYPTHRQTDHPRASAAGSMTTTVNDLSRFLTAYLAGKILEPSTRAEMLTSQLAIHTLHEAPTLSTETGTEGDRVGLSAGLGWVLLTRTRYGLAFSKEGWVAGIQNYLICFTRSGTCMILLTNSNNGTLAFRPLLEKLIGDNATPWEWMRLTRNDILQDDEHTLSK
ncbi:MAG TPA: serine hydrolase domain-containing protein [Acidobacteriaceae bacterium]|nr:serine hydrolase domain-containing protein [Acidobacteriaceae bacterium]